MCDSFIVEVKEGHVTVIDVPSATPTCVVVQIIEDIEAIVHNLRVDPPLGGMS